MVEDILLIYYIQYNVAPFCFKSMSSIQGIKP